MKIETIPLSKIKPAVYNPRKDLKPGDPEYEKLKKSLSEFDIVEPLVWNKRTGNLVGGHQRLKLLKERGDKQVDVSVVDLPDEKEKALNLALNKISGEWDFPRLKDLLEEINTGAFDIEITGFDDKEIEDLMTQFHVPGEGLTDDDAIPEQVETVCKAGDLWQLGNHRLLCGDCTQISNVERLMGGEKADMVFTDPPYEMDTKGGGILKTSKAMKGIRDSHIDTFDPSSLVKMADISVYCCNKPLIPGYIELADNWGDAWDLAVYHKQNVTPNYGGHLMTDIEYLMLIGKQSPYSGQNKGLYSKVFTGDKDADNKLAWSKPVSLCEKFLRLYSKVGNIVLDLFGGSGSTLIACEKLGRRCFMMEIDCHFGDVIIKRWEDFTGKKAELING
jgi:DNA modification methylase